MATKTRKKKKTRKNIRLSKWQIMIIISTIMLALIAGLTAAAITSDRPAPMLDTNKDIANGIDVSHHNGKIDWSSASKDIDFAIIRVGYRGYADGNIAKDKRAEYNLRHAIRAGVPVGAYFFTQAVTPEEAEEEAQFVLDTIRGYDVTLPIFIDYEYGVDKKGKETGRLLDAKLSAKQATTVVNAFCRVINDAGYTSGVYCSAYGYNAFFHTSGFNRNTVIWLAEYHDQVRYRGNYDIWQYTNKGKMDAVQSKYVDMNHWYINKGAIK